MSQSQAADSATANPEEYGRDYLLVYLNGQQTPLFLETEAVVKRAIGADATRGEVVRELCRSYLLICDKQLSDGVKQLTPDHASNHDEPTYSIGELENIDMQRLRKMASRSRSDEVSGRSTKLELWSYYAEEGKLDNEP